MAFELGVFVELQNWSFEQFDRFMEIDTDYTSGTSLIVKGDQTVQPIVLGVGNKIWVGPSSETTWEGAIEEATVSSVTLPGNGTTVITLTGAMDADFNAGDFVKVRTVALGWTGEDDTPQTARKYSREFGYAVGDKEQRYAQRVYAGGAHISNYMAYQYTPVNSITPGEVYRLTYRYKCESGSIGLDWVKADDTYISAQATGYGSVAAWTAGVQAAMTAPSGANKAKIKMWISNVSTKWVTVDDMVLYHAIGCSDEANARVELTGEPDLGSVIYGFRRRYTDKFYAKDLLRREYPDTLEDEPLKLEISAVFSQLDTTDINNINQLLFWQKQGKKIILKPEITGLPETLVGYLNLSWSKNIWDLTQTDLQFRFLEA